MSAQTRPTAREGHVLRLAVVTDEVSPDPAEAVSIAMQDGVYDFELRNVGPTRFPDYSDAVVDQLCLLRDKYRIRYTSVSPGWLKRSPVNVRRAFELGHTLEAPRVMLFAGPRGGHVASARTLRDIVKRAVDSGFTVSLENSANTAVCSWQEVRQMIETVGPGLRVNWDPGNAAMMGHMDVTEGYRQLRPWIDNIHLKDVALLPDSQPSYVPIGEGVLGISELLRQLIADEYTGCVTIETHCSCRVDAFQKSVREVRRILEREC